MQPLRIRNQNQKPHDEQTNITKPEILSDEEAPPPGHQDNGAVGNEHDSSGTGLYEQIQYPQLPDLPPPLKPRQRQPGLTKTPSYASSPIISGLPRSPANAGRKRANAISLTESPARRSHSANMKRIFEKSRETIEFQDAIRKGSLERKRQADKENNRQQSGEPMTISEKQYLPLFSSLGSLSDDMPGGLMGHLNHPAPSVSSASRAPSTATINHHTSGDFPASVIEQWLEALPERPPQTPRPNIGMLRSPGEPLSPSARTHRLCASTSSIAQRIQMRSPARFPSFKAELKTQDEAEKESTSLLSRLLHPAARPSSRKDSGYSVESAKPRRLQSRVKPASVSSQPSCSFVNENQASMQQKLGPSDSEWSATDSTPSDSGSSGILHPPKIRKSSPSPQDQVTPSAQPSHRVVSEEVKTLTPEVAVRRRGRSNKIASGGGKEDAMSSPLKHEA